MTPNAVLGNKDFQFAIGQGAPAVQRDCGEETLNTDRGADYPMTVGEVFEMPFTACCGEPVAFLGSAGSTSRGYLRVSLGRCPSCESWQWAMTMKLDRPWANGVQAGKYLQQLRAQVLAQLYAGERLVS